jgi:hypothetical protein
MKNLILALAVAAVSCLALGCAEKTSTTEKKTISTPGGKTTTEKSEEVKKTGEYPP